MLNIYFYSLLSSLLLVYIGLFNEKRALINKLVLYIVVAITAFFLGSRDMEAGSDTIAYVTAFNKLVEFERFDFIEIQAMFLLTLSTSTELLFMFFAFVTSRLTDSYSVYLWLYTFFCLLVIARAYEKSTQKPLLVYFLLCCSLSLVFLYGNTIRQAAAVSIFIYALVTYLEDRSYKKYVFFIVLGFLFHMSAIIFLFAPLFLRLSKNKLIFMLVFVLVSSVIGLLPIFFSLLPGNFFVDKLIVYFTKYKASIFNFNTISFFIFYGITDALVRFYSLPSEHRLNTLLKCYAVIFLFQAVFIGNSELFIRIGFYKTVFEPILIFAVFDTLKASQRQAGKLVLLMISFIYFISYVFFDRSIFGTLH